MISLKRVTSFCCQKKLFSAKKLFLFLSLDPYGVRNVAKKINFKMYGRMPGALHLDLNTVLHFGPLAKCNNIIMMFSGIISMFGFTHAIFCRPYIVI